MLCLRQDLPSGQVKRRQAYETRGKITTQRFGDFLSIILRCVNSSLSSPVFATRHVTELRILEENAPLSEEATVFELRINKNSLLQAQKELCQIQPDTVIFSVSYG